MTKKQNQIIKRLSGILVSLTLFASWAPPANAVIIFTNEVFKNDSPIYEIGSDKNTTTENLSLNFGGTNTESLSWNATGGAFSISDDLSLGQNQLKDLVIDNQSSAPSSPVAGQIYHNTSNGNTYIWNGSTWEDITVGAPTAADFEGVYSNDTDKILTTSNGAFTIAAGTGAVNVNSTTGGVSLNNNINGAVNIATGTSTGAVGIGGGSGTVAIDTTSWGISSAGAASGFTTVDASGNITTSGGDFVIGTTGLTETTSATDSGAYKVGAFDEFDNSNSTTVQGVLNDVDNTLSNIGGTNANTFILDKDDTGGAVKLQFGTSLNESLAWNSVNSEFDLSDDLNLGKAQLKAAAIENLASAPGSPVEGQIYYNTVSKKIFQWNGTVWKDLVAEPHAASHVDGTDDIQLATVSQKGLMSAQAFQDLQDLNGESDEINRNTIDVQLSLGTNVASSVAYLTYDNPFGTTFVANIENSEYVINDSPTAGIALTGGSNASPVLNYVYVRESGMTAFVEASTTDPATQSFNYVPIGEVLLGTVGVSSATYYFIENLTNYIRNFIGDTNNRLRVTGVIWLSGIALTNTGLEIATTQGTVIHMHEEITYPAKDTTTDNMIDFYYNTYGALDNTNYDNGTGGNTAIGNNKFHKLFIWGDIYGGLHMERQRKPPSSEYTALAQAEEDPDSVSVNSIPSQWVTVGFPIAHLILQQGTANVLKIIDLRAGGGGGGAVAGGHTQNTDTGTTGDTFTLDADNSGTNISLVFGAALNKSLLWDSANTRFTMNGALRVEGNEAVVGQEFVAGSHTATDSDGVLNVGRNASAWESLMWNDTTDRFEFSDDLTINGGLVTGDGASIGNNTGTIAIDSTDWDISATGAMTGIGAVSMDGLLTGTAGATLSGAAINLNASSNFATNIGTGTSTGTVTLGGNSNNIVVDSALWNVTSGGALDAATVTSNGLLTGSAGATISGATTNVNNNSNFASNINTGTSTGAVSIGGGSGTVAVNSTSWDVSTAGVASGLTGITSTGTVDFGGASRLALHQGAANPGTCTEGDVFYNTATNSAYVCTSTNTWTVLSSGNPDFETVFGADADKTLVTGNAAFTVNTGTNDFVVDSNDWNVDASGNLDAVNVTANGNTTLGVGGTDTVAINTSSWDVSTAGVASGLTGITSTGAISFSAASSFHMPQSASDPGTCTVGQQYYNTTSNEMRLCTATNTWTNVGSTTGANYTFAYDTTTQTVATANTFQDINFSTNALLNGWTHTASTANFTAGASGLYLISVDAGLTGTATNATAEIRAMFNGVEVAGSQISRNMDNEYLSNRIGTTFLLNATSGQILKFQLTANSTAASIAPGGANATTRPSIKVTIVRIN